MSKMLIRLLIKGTTSLSTIRAARTKVVQTIDY